MLHLGDATRMNQPQHKPANLRDLRASGWRSKTVKQEIHDNFLRMLREEEELFPGIVGYDDTVIPEINIALLAKHDMLFLGEKGQAKSRLMRLLVRFLDDEIPFIDIPEAPLHDDPYRPISSVCRRFVASYDEAEVPIGWWRSVRGGFRGAGGSGRSPGWKRNRWTRRAIAAPARCAAIRTRAVPG